jgi:glycosyltransferase involved in cell wall biosynthesis
MVSVVILTQDPPSNLLTELRRNQTFQDFEIIIASADGIVNAMNDALKRSKGEIFVRIDDDVSLPDKWLEELIKPFKDLSVVGVTGPTYIPLGNQKNRDSIKYAKRLFKNKFFRWLMDGRPEAPAKIFKCGAVSYGSNYLACIDKNKNYEIDHLEGTNWAVRTKGIQAVGGFDPAFNGVAEWYDDDVIFKIKERYSWARLVYNPKAYLFHLPGRDHHYYKRREWLSRIANWLRFHWRHTGFHYKKVIWLCLMIGYYLTKKND